MLPPNMRRVTPSRNFPLYPEIGSPTLGCGAPFSGRDREADFPLVWLVRVNDGARMRSDVSHLLS